MVYEMKMLQSGVALTHLGLVGLGLKKPPSIQLYMGKVKLFWNMEIVIKGEMLLYI